MSKNLSNRANINIGILDNVWRTLTHQIRPTIGSHAICEANDSTEKAKKTALIKNNVAMSYMLFVLTTKEGLGMLEESKSDEFPGGEARLVW